MIVSSLLYIVFIVFIVLIIGLIIKAKKRNILISIPVVGLCIPIIFIALLYVFKSPIQQGEILQDTRIGLFLNLIFPPSDLYDSIGSLDLKPDKEEYTLNFSNKYLGNHALMVSSPRPAKEDNPSYSDISVTLSVSNGETEIFNMGPERAGKFIGRSDYGAFLAWYKVPRDLPISENLVATIRINGNLKEFLDRRGQTTLTIQKYSDQ